MSGSIRFRSLREYYCNQLSGITSILPKKGINIIRYYHRCSSSEYYKQKCIYCKSTIFFHYYFKPGKTMKTFFKSKLKKGVDYRWITGGLQVDYRMCGLQVWIYCNPHLFSNQNWKKVWITVTVNLIIETLPVATELIRQVLADWRVSFTNLS
jgi:hypothetical protein